MKKTSIVILTGNSLCHNPRVIKEATALSAAGCQVEVLGAWLDAALRERDQTLLADLPFQFTPVLDVTQDKWLWTQSRLCVKAARLWHQRTGRETRWQLGYTVDALTRAARRRQADLFIAHSEPALWALKKLQKQKAESRKQKTNAETLKTEIRKPEGACQFQLSAFSFQNFRIGVDLEDWFSEDLTPESRRQRPIQLLKSLERGALSTTAHSTCTSRAMSEALAKEFGCRPPTVIYNAFPWADRKKLDGRFKDRRDRRVPSLHWYSQTLGQGRGLEDLFAALPFVQRPLEIHLRGNPMAGFNQWLEEQLPEQWRSRVFVHDLVSNDELLSRIAEHDIGFAGEQKYSLNKELTVSNKILHYLLGGLAVVASDTAGQQEVAEQASGAVRIYPAGDSQALAKELNWLLASAEALHTAKATALQAAEQTFCWERQVPVLTNTVAKAIESCGE